MKLFQTPETSTAVVDLDREYPPGPQHGVGHADADPRPDPGRRVATAVVAWVRAIARQNDRPGVTAIHTQA